MNPDNCEKCQASFIGDPIPEASRHYYGNATHFRNEIGLYDMYRDRTTQWKCHKCGYVWDRT